MSNKKDRQYYVGAHYYTNGGLLIEIIAKTANHIIGRRVNPRHISGYMLFTLDGKYKRIKNPHYDLIRPHHTLHKTITVLQTVYQAPDIIVVGNINTATVPLTTTLKRCVYLDAALVLPPINRDVAIYQKGIRVWEYNGTSLLIPRPILVYGRP